MRKYLWPIAFFALLVSTPARAQQPPDATEESEASEETGDEGIEGSEEAEEAKDAELKLEPAMEELSDAEPHVSEDRVQTRITTTTRAPIPKFVTDRSANVVEEEDLLRRQAKSTTDALEEEQGVFTQSTNRGAGSVFLRGLIGPENQIYVDGVRFNQSTFRTGPNQYLDTIDPWALQRIEVLRGPGSVLYGSGAMGGVIQLFPEQIDDGPLDMWSRGSVETADLGVGFGARAAAKPGRLGALIGGSGRRHGDLRIGDFNGNDIVVAGETDDGEMVQSGFDEYHWRGGVSYDVMPRSTLRLNYLGASILDAPRTDRLGNGEIRFYDNRDDLLYATYEFDGPQGIVDDVRFNFSYHRTEENVERFNCRRVEIAPAVETTPDPLGCARLEPEHLRKRRVNEDIVETFGTSATVQSSVPEWNLRFTWGSETYTDFVESARWDAAAPEFAFRERDRGNFADGSTYGSTAVFGYGEGSLLGGWPHDIIARAGVRGEHFRAVAPDVTEELGDVEYDFTGVVGSAGLAYVYGTSANIYLNWNQGFRAPNLQESTVLGDTGNTFEVPNPDLGPERSNTFELGTKLDVSDWVRFTGASWVSLLNDRITREDTTFEGASTINDKPVRHRVNRDTAYYYGADAGLETADFYDVFLHGNVAWIDGAVESSEEDPNFKDGPFHDLFGSAEHYENPRRLPPLNWLAGITWEPGDWYATFFARGALSQDKLSDGDLDDLRICEVQPGVLYTELGRACPGSGDWTTLNVRGGWKKNWIRIDLAMENIADLRYRPHGSGVPGAGFNVKGMVTVYQR